MPSPSNDPRRHESQQGLLGEKHSGQPGMSNQLSELQVPDRASHSVLDAIKTGKSEAIAQREEKVRAEPHGLVRSVRSLCASIAERPERIVDAVASAAAAMLTVTAVTASGAPLTGGDVGLGIAVAGATLASVEFGDQLSRNNPISVTSPLRNWSEGFGDSVRWLKEAFDEDGLKVCIGALVTLYCASLPPELYGKVGMVLGTARMVVSLTCVAALRCVRDLVALPCAVMSTFYRAVAKPIQECAKWGSRESLRR